MVRDSAGNTKRYRDLNTYLRGEFGCRVQKVSLDAGFTCPNRDGTLGRSGCLYCNARGSGTGAFARGLSITAQLRQSMEYLSRRYRAEKFLAYFQSYCNTYGPPGALRAAYDAALSVPGVVGLSIGTRPDCVDAAVLDLIQEYARTCHVWVEYGLQSARDETLRRIGRGHDFAAFCRAVSQTTGRGIRICAHVILGLPGETRDDMLATARAVADLPLDAVKIHLLYVVRGTGLAQLYDAGRYRCLGQAEYVDLVCDFLELLPPQMIIQRLTGDPHAEELLAPQWALERARNRALIEARLEDRNTCQGRRYRPGV